MRIGFDVDGVLANFFVPYQNLTLAVDGRNLFQPGDDTNPPTWNWPELRGYSKDVMSEVWRLITASKSFWYNQPPLPGADTLALLIADLEHNHDVYYVTARPGATAKRQTEAWLARHIGYNDIRPTVLISSNKGYIAKALKLDVYVDDRLDNIVDVERVSPETRAYLLDYNYNRVPEHQEILRRVKTLGEVFDAELHNL